MTTSKSAYFYALLSLCLGLFASTATAKDEVNSSLFGNVAIESTDPVAYFTEGKAVKGRKDFEHVWKDAKWRFSSAANRDLFAADPERYAPQYGGYCAYAVSQGYTAGIDPEAWSIVGDRLFLNYSKEVQEEWLDSRDAFIEAADENWPSVLE
ncbi:MAG: YHS domain-containing (seleno)protein [Congregibacter sp.]